MQALFKNRPVLSYLLITFFITYLFWFLPVLIEIPRDIGFSLNLIGGCGPLIAAFLITASNSKATIKVHSKSIFAIVFILAFVVLILRLNSVDPNITKEQRIPPLEEISILAYILFSLAFFVLALNASNAKNGQLKENHIRTFLPEKGKLKWYFIGFILIPVLSYIGYGIGYLVGTPLTDFILKADYKFVLGLACTFLFFGSNEEFGWRGFMQKELQKKRSPLIAALIISFFWSLWHLPLHYNGYYGTGGIVEMLPRFVWMIPMTIIFSWLYNKSKYALLTAMILHAVMNNAQRAFGTSEWIYFYLTIAAAIYFVISDKMWKRKDFQVN